MAHSSLLILPEAMHDLNKKIKDVNAKKLATANWSLGSCIYIYILFTIIIYLYLSTIGFVELYELESGCCM